MVVRINISFLLPVITSGCFLFPTKFLSLPPVSILNFLPLEEANTRERPRKLSPFTEQLSRLDKISRLFVETLNYIRVYTMESVIFLRHTPLGARGIIADYKGYLANSKLSVLGDKRDVGRIMSACSIADIIWVCTF